MESRGQADWVIVVDIDEHIFHPDLGGYLARSLAQGVTIIPALGYEMLCNTFPESDERLCDTRRFGAPAGDMCKLAVFAPDAIESLRHAPGGHTSAPTGRVVAPAIDQLLLLHYKLLGHEYVASRHTQLRDRLGSRDLKNGWAHHWSASENDVGGTFERYRSTLVDVSAVGATPAQMYPAPRWWAGTVSRLEDRVRVAELETKLAAATDVSLARERHLQEAERQLASARDAALERERRLRETERQLAASRDELMTRTARVTALESSRSWRWTGPIRRTIDAIPVSALTRMQATLSRLRLRR